MVVELSGLFRLGGAEGGLLLRSIQPHSPFLVLLPLPKLVYFRGWYVCEEWTSLFFLLLLLLLLFWGFFVCVCAG